MFKTLSAVLTEKALHDGIIKHEEVEQTRYGVNSFITLVCNVITALIIGIIFNMVLEIILFILTYKSLRKYCGGGHSDTAIKCYISSCLTYLVVLFAIMYYPLTDLQTTMTTLASCVILFFISPVEAVKKPLDEIETKTFRFRSRVSVIICLCICFILLYIPYTHDYSIIIAVGIVTVTLFAIEGKIQLAYFRTTKTG